MTSESIEKYAEHLKTSNIPFYYDPADIGETLVAATVLSLGVPVKSYHSLTTPSSCTIMNPSRYSDRSLLERKAITTDPSYKNFIKKLRDFSQMKTVDYHTLSWIWVNWMTACQAIADDTKKPYVFVPDTAVTQNDMNDQQSFMETMNTIYARTVVESRVYRNGIYRFFGYWDPTKDGLVTVVAGDIRYAPWMAYMLKSNKNECIAIKDSNTPIEESWVRCRAFSRKGAQILSQFVRQSCK